MAIGLSERIRHYVRFEAVATIDFENMNGKIRGGIKRTMLTGYDGSSYNSATAEVIQLFRHHVNLYNEDPWKMAYRVLNSSDYEMMKAKALLMQLRVTDYSVEINPRWIQSQSSLGTSHKKLAQWYAELHKDYLIPVIFEKWTVQQMSFREDILNHINDKLPFTVKVTK